MRSTIPGGNADRLGFGSDVLILVDCIDVEEVVESSCDGGPDSRVKSPVTSPLIHSCLKPIRSQYSPMLTRSSVELVNRLSASSSAFTLLLIGSFFFPGEVAVEVDWIDADELPPPSGLGFSN